MTNKVHDAFEQIHAEEALKQKTMQFLTNKINKKARKYTRISTVFASIMIFAFAGAFLSNAYFTPTAYIDIDINPSIELTVNRFGRVLSATSYNNDGELILKNISLNNKSYDDSVKIIFDELESESLLDKNSLLSVTVQSKNNQDQEEILVNTKTTVDLYLQNHHSNIQTDVYAISQDVKINAQQNNISPAKYIAITDLQKVDATANFEECKGHSVLELKQLTQSHEHNQNGHH